MILLKYVITNSMVPEPENASLCSYKPNTGVIFTENIFVTVSA
jgi:hypothetical protein